MAEDADGAGGGLEDVQDHPDGGGLARAIGPEKTADGTGGNGEGDIIHRLENRRKNLVTPLLRGCVTLFWTGYPPS